MQIAARPDQRGAAPVRMRRRGEDRLVEHVLPVAGEFLLARRRAPPPNAAARRRRRPPRARRPAARPTARSAIGSAGRAAPAPAPGRSRSPGRKPSTWPGHDAAVAQGEPDLLGLGDQIADGEHDAVFADQHAVAGALGAERLGGEGVGRHDRADADDGAERAIEIVVVVLRLRLRAGRHRPVRRRDILRNSSVAEPRRSPLRSALAQAS